MSSAYDNPMASGKAIGAVSIVFGILAVISVLTRLVLACTRKLSLRLHDVATIIALPGVVTLCVWNAIGGLYGIVPLGTPFFRNNPEYTLYYYIGEDGATDTSYSGLAAVTIIHIWCSFFLVIATFDFLQKFWGWRKALPAVVVPLFLVGCLYGGLLVVAIVGLFARNYFYFLGYLTGTAVLDFLVILSASIVVLSLYRRRPALPFKSWLSIPPMVIMAIFVFIAAIVQLAFFAQLTSFAVDLIFDRNRRDYDGYATDNFLFYGLLFNVLLETSWIIALCVPTFTTSIQQVANEDRIRRWPAYNRAYNHG